MTEQRQKLLDRFDKWLDSKPRKQIISAQCANIAEEYAEEQLRLHGVVKQSELLPKRLSNAAYLNAREMRYEDFVKWWDEQVQVIVA